MKVFLLFEENIVLWLVLRYLFVWDVFDWFKCFVFVFFYRSKLLYVLGELSGKFFYVIFYGDVILNIMKIFF